MIQRSTPWAAVTEAAKAARKAALDTANAWSGRRKAQARALATRADAALAAYHAARARAAELEPENPEWTPVHELRAAAWVALAAPPELASQAVQALRELDAGYLGLAPKSMAVRSALQRARVDAFEAAQLAERRALAASPDGEIEQPPEALARAVAAAQAADLAVTQARAAARMAWSVVESLGGQIGG